MTDRKKRKLGQFTLGSLLITSIRYKPKPIVIENKRWDPMTATSSALLGTMVDFSTGLGTTVINPVKGLTKMGGSLVKGALVDVPLALTDGLAATSNLVGGKERTRGTIDDWKSGSKEAGKVCHDIIQPLSPRQKHPNTYIEFFTQEFLYWF